MRASILALSIWALGFLPDSAQADMPRVVADIAPVHSLVAQVMEGIGTPQLLLRPDVSPHDYALRPSEARALQDADAVFWIGPELTPPLERALETLSENAQHVILLEVQGITLHDPREMAVFRLEDEDHDEHAHDEDKHDEHAHDEDKHDEHAHDEDKHDEQAHSEDAHGHDDHDHGDASVDPHAWLEPDNARIWLTQIAETLAAVDPANAGTYRENAQMAQNKLDDVVADVTKTLAPVKSKPFLVYHDAYRYFETRFGLAAAGAIAASDAVKPGAARLRKLRDLVAAQGVVCVFHEPQFTPRLADSLASGGDLRVAELDPIGIDIALGPDHYATLITSLAQDMAGCLSSE